MRRSGVRFLSPAPDQQRASPHKGLALFAWAQAGLDLPPLATSPQILRTRPSSEPGVLREPEDRFHPPGGLEHLVHINTGFDHRVVVDTVGQISLRSADHSLARTDDIRNRFRLDLRLDMTACARGDLQPLVFAQVPQEQMGKLVRDRSEDDVRAVILVQPHLTGSTKASRPFLLFSRIAPTIPMQVLPR